MDNDQLLQAIGAKLNTFKEQIAEVIAGNCAELHTQINERCDALAAQITLTHATVKSLSDSHMAHMKSVITFMEWANGTEDRLVKYSERLRDLEARLSKLEGAA